MGYEDDIGYVIGSLFYSADTNATAGSIADAFENFGILGLVIYPFVIVVSILLFDSIARDIRPEYYVSLIFVYAYSVMSGPLTIAILSYGFIFGTIYLWLLKTADSKAYLMPERQVTA